VNSDKILKTKLGLLDEMSTLFLKAPAEYFATLGYRPRPYDDVDGEYDFIHAFYTNKNDLSGYADILLSKLSDKGMLWVSWPKLSAQKDKSLNLGETDITEQDLRDILLPKGVVDGKVCAVTEVWSGLKFVWKR
jgi:hypothetical protein